MSNKKRKAVEDGFGYDFELDDVCKTIEKNAYKNILLQFPEGLKNTATNVKEVIENRTKVNVLISADLCFGSCDIPLALTPLEIDFLVQFGHMRIPNLKYPYPVMFVEAHSNLDVIPPVKKATKLLTGKVGLITVAQHIHKLTDVKNYLEQHGFETSVGKASSRTAGDGQVLGCDLSSATSISSEVDSFLFIGSGNFHAVGVAIATRKSVIIADPYQNEARDCEDIKNRMMRQRHGAIAKTKDALSFGIIVGTKPGQTRMKLAYDLKRLLEKHEKQAYILVMNQISPAALKPFKFDAFVSTACPRVAIDDYLMYDTPILTPMELKIVLGEVEWDDYRFDETF
jgi:2-(3-amino-3-carboxypropyl)histidine synthase